MAVLAPEMTAWVGSLSLASWHTSPCAASAASFSAASLPTPSRAAMAPCPTGTAACMARPRVFEQAGGVGDAERAGRGKRRIFAERMAGHILDLAGEAEALLCSSTRMTASETAISAGWAFSVSVSVSSGPLNMMSESFWPSAASTSSNTARAEAWALASSAPMPTAWLPCPGNTNAMVIGSTELHRDLRLDTRAAFLSRRA